MKMIIRTHAMPMSGTEQTIDNRQITRHSWKCLNHENALHVSVFLASVKHRRYSSWSNNRFTHSKS